MHDPSSLHSRRKFFDGLSVTRDIGTQQIRTMIDAIKKSFKRIAPRIHMLENTGNRRAYARSGRFFARILLRFKEGWPGSGRYSQRNSRDTENTGPSISRRGAKPPSLRIQASLTDHLVHRFVPFPERLLSNLRDAAASLIFVFRAPTVEIEHSSHDTTRQK